MSTSHPSSPLPSLPPSRDFMTSLFNSLTFPNASPTQTSNPNPNPDSDSNSNSASVAHPQRLSRENERDDGKQTQNPFKQLDTQKKALLMTLHVIFPPPLLLHALDLLDRGGVTRVILREEGEIGGRAGTGEDVEQRNDRERKGTEKKSSDAGEQEQESSRDMEGGDIEVGESGINAHKHKLSLLHPSPSHPSPNPPPPKSKQKQKPLYQVHSSQPSKWHSSRSTCGTGAGTTHAHAAAENTYAVYLDAWNCSCAAFTFSAFPASTSTSTSTSTSLASSYFPWDSEVSPDEEHPIPEQREKEQEETWRYGGWTKTSHVPICKHLLACLLVERWGDVLGTCVRERVVGREEMGGLVV